jgi:putative GTP pyrophosphokinase
VSIESKSQIDRLGQRLRTGNVTDDDLRELDAYRRSFNAPYQLVVETVRRTLNIDPTGRPAKSTTSIVDKLRRETIRLSQVQDIAGCRLVVADMREQDIAVAALVAALPGSSVVDRRKKPSNGYRAVHVVPKVEFQPVEIQVRTSLQHLWAEFSEKLSDVLDSGIKYGTGDEESVKILGEISQAVDIVESVELAGPDVVNVPADVLAESKHRLKDLLERSIERASSARKENE